VLSAFSSFHKLAKAINALALDIRRLSTLSILTPTTITTLTITTLTITVLATLCMTSLLALMADALALLLTLHDTLDLGLIVGTLTVLTLSRSWNADDQC
jgi:hypothetical protein